ncbi:MAG: efflux RND transporter periplasmic adaptor subunit [Betaproteobacteria bacterium HGW-Betaproteobacteria-2]|nr:MAG: efflux RND transporter periplasmic adaptor subunit [Betaproteobacteria bacterium HGW-Betaproteobacteria-2]
MIRNWLIRLAILAIAATGIYFYLQSQAPAPEARYRLQQVTRGDVAKSVSANGTLNPVTIVSVGTQVSGRVNKLYVDFNDKVEEGQILLELDDSLLTAQIAQTMGNIRNIQASVDLATANEVRMRTLYEQEYVSKQELDQAVQALKSAQAQLESNRAQLKRDQTNLGYSIIRSPVSGVVIDRVVDLGQTVAASFQTPELIRIAQDLSKMQINSSFAEADIGNIREGQIAKFHVDAFPDQSFEGIVKQLRLNPTVTSNVVTYDVVISVDNPDEILLPGMTAYVNIEIERSNNALLVPNSALRFKPAEDDSASSSARGLNGSSNNPGPGQGKVYVLQGGKPVAIEVKTGITDGRVTGIINDSLQPGDKIIVGDSLQQPTNSSSSSMRFRMF